MTPHLVATGPCFIHEGLFSFDPGRVQSVLIDPATGRPPDVDAAGRPVPADDPGMAERVRRCVQRFICPQCCKALNVEARRQGLPAHFDETDTSGGQVQR